MTPHGGSALAGALDFLERWELPLVSPQHSIWQPLLRRASEDGATVMLRGELGDELFANSPYLLADRVRRGRLLSAWGLARRCPGGREASRRRVAALRGAETGCWEPLRAAWRNPCAGSGGGAATPRAWFSEESARLHLEHADEWRWKDALGAALVGLPGRAADPQPGGVRVARIYAASGCRGRAAVGESVHGRGVVRVRAQPAAGARVRPGLQPPSAAGEPRRPDPGREFAFAGRRASSTQSPTRQPRARTSSARASCWARPRRRSTHMCNRAWCGSGS